MRTAEGILEEYRKGDFYRRLNLYLQYRDLRREFTQIDSDERAIHKLPREEERRDFARDRRVTGASEH